MERRGAGTQAAEAVCTKEMGPEMNEWAALLAGGSAQGSLPLPDKESLLNSIKDQTCRKAKALCFSETLALSFVK